MSSDVEIADKKGAVTALASVIYLCQNGVSSVSMTVHDAYFPKNQADPTLPVYPGDQLQIIVRVSVTRGITATIDDITRPNAVVGVDGHKGSNFGSFSILDNGTPGETLPAFSAIHVSRVLVSGMTLDQVPNLTEFVMVNSDEQPLVEPSPVASNGRGFRLTLMQNGIVG